MELFTFKLFDEEEVSQIHKKLIPNLTWDDGRDTAQGKAKELKKNVQAMPEKNAEAVKSVLAKIQQNNAIQNTCFPHSFPRAFFNRYDAAGTDGDAPGAYEKHVDKTLIQQRRVDFSFTVFLSDPKEYEGGELVITRINNEIKMKPEAGHICLYASGLVHEVKPVVKGSRLGLVGWMTSAITNSHDRMLMVEVRNYANFLTQKKGLEYNDTLKLIEIEQNLIRRFS
ncbi:Fe2+-dependent dioxygenase [Alphaproteobacteria bacterium]|nr:Fe2+-dependent dioxygenase [Alphaproteobacteria bacterium]